MATKVDFARDLFNQIEIQVLSRDQQGTGMVNFIKEK
jgi:hypothetical protein